MLREQAQPRYQRFAVLAAVFAFHLAAIVVLLLQRETPSKQIAKPATIALMTLNAERPATAVPPPPTLPSKIADTFEPETVVSVPDDGQQDAVAGATMACAPHAALLEALLRDPGLVDIIRRAPPETRSVADAIVMWNDGWSPAAVGIGSPLELVRANIEQSLAKIEARCLDEPVAGPRMLPIPDGTGNGAVFLVFGSGNWTWRSLVPTPATARASNYKKPEIGSVSR